MAAVKTEVLNIRISENEKAKLKEIAAKKDIPMSQIIREIIKNYIQEESQK